MCRQGFHGHGPHGAAVLFFPCHFRERLGGAFRPKDGIPAESAIARGRGDGARDATLEIMHPLAVVVSETPEIRTGAFTFVTDDSLEDVLSFYGSKLESAGFTIANRTTTPEGGLLVAKASDSSRTASVTASTKDGNVEVMVNFSEKR